MSFKHRQVNCKLPSIEDRQRHGLDRPACRRLFSIRPISLLTLALTSPRLYAEQAVVLPVLEVSESNQSGGFETAGQTTALARSDLDAANYSDWNQVLRNLPGVVINQSNGSNASGLSFRGAPGGVGLLTLDGVPLFSSFTSFVALSHFPLDFFENARLERGVAEKYDGSRTLGGSLKLHSRQLQADRGFWRSEAGSYGTLHNNLGFGEANAAGHFSVFGGRTDILEGLSQAQPENAERDNFHMNNGLLRWDHNLDQGAIDGSLYFVNTREQVDGPGILPNHYLGWKDDPNGLLLENSWVAQTHGYYALSSKWDTELRLGFTQDSQQGQSGNIAGRAIPVDLTSRLWIAHWENSYLLPLHGSSQLLRMVWGIDTQQQQGSSLLSPAMHLSRSNTLISPIFRTELDYGKWLANLALRYDHDLNYGDHPVFSAAASWRISSEMLLWAKVGTGYRSPAVNELLNPIFGNRSLRGETSRGGEIGWRWQIANADEVSVSSYWQQYHDLIVLEQNAATGSMGSKNVDRAEVWGVELSLKHRWNPRWQSEISYGYMSARDAISHRQMGYRPEHQGQMATTWQIVQPLKFRVGLSFRDSYWVDLANSHRVGPAPRLNANLDYQLSAKLRLYLKGENLNDERTPDLYGFNFLGASVYAGMHWDW